MDVEDGHRSLRFMMGFVWNEMRMGVALHFKDHGFYMFAWNVEAPSALRVPGFQRTNISP